MPSLDYHSEEALPSVGPTASTGLASRTGQRCLTADLGLKVPGLP